MHVYSTEKEEKKKEGTVGGGKELKIRKSRWWRKCMWPLWVKRYGHKGKNHSSEVGKTDIQQIKEPETWGFSVFISALNLYLAL